MERGLIDIRSKAKEFSKKHGELSRYPISCKTLIAILDELEIAQKESEAARAYAIRNPITARELVAVFDVDDAINRVRARYGLPPKT